MMKKIFLIFVGAFVILFNTKNEVLDFSKQNLAKAYEEYNAEIRRIEYQKYLKFKMDTIIHVVGFIESRHDSTQYNKLEKAAGLLQTRPIMVDDVNLLLRKNGINKSYTLKDRWSAEKSIEMFIDYQKFVNPTFDEELACRKWNGGRSGHKKKSTDWYVDEYFKRKKQLFKKEV